MLQCSRSIFTFGRRRFRRRDSRFHDDAPRKTITPAIASRHFESAGRRVAISATAATVTRIVGRRAAIPAHAGSARETFDCLPPPEATKLET